MSVLLAYWPSLAGGVLTAIPHRATRQQRREAPDDTTRTSIRPAGGMLMQGDEHG
jgi:hypothetical protein